MPFYCFLYYGKHSHYFLKFEQMMTVFISQHLPVLQWRCTWDSENVRRQQEHSACLGSEQLMTYTQLSFWPIFLFLHCLGHWVYPWLWPSYFITSKYIWNSLPLLLALVTTYPFKDSSQSHSRRGWFGVKMWTAKFCFRGKKYVANKIFKCLKSLWTTF